MISSSPSGFALSTPLSLSAARVAVEECCSWWLPAARDPPPAALACADSGRCCLLLSCEAPGLEAAAKGGADAGRGTALPRPAAAERPLPLDLAPVTHPYRPLIDMLKDAHMKHGHEACYEDIAGPKALVPVPGNRCTQPERMSVHCVLLLNQQTTRCKLGQDSQAT